MLMTDNLLSQMRSCVLKLEERQFEITNEAEKTAFHNELDNFRNVLHELEKQDLQSVLTKLQSSEAQLNQAIISLDKELQSVNNTVNIISNIKSVTSIVARIIPIV